MSYIVPATRRMEADRAADPVRSGPFRTFALAWGEPMRKSTRVALTLVGAVALAGCGRRHLDPCDSASFDELACQDAVRSGGYYWGGTWYPMQYHYPYPYYYDQYRSYVVRGGTVTAAPGGSYAHPGVVRGGFGSTGAAHGAAGGE